MRALLERIDPSFGSSFALRQFHQRATVRDPFWHFHPEYEIVFISNGSGKRHIGNHVSYYTEGDLIFLGPNIPHLSFTDDLLDQHTEIVLQLRDDFMGAHFLDRPEMHEVKALFQKSQQGITFHGRTKALAGAILSDMLDMAPLDRLVELLKLFQMLARSEEYTLLKAEGMLIEIAPQDQERVGQVYTHVEENFTREIPLEEIAALVHMTVPAFCRYFKKLTGKTFTHLVNEVRINHACKMLSEGSHSIATLCYESGFNNFSHFNKVFKQITGVTPSDYRQQMRKLVAVG